MRLKLDLFFVRKVRVNPQVEYTLGVNGQTTRCYTLVGKIAYYDWLGI